MASELETLLAIEQNGDLNPAQRSRLQQLKASGSYGNSSGIIGGPDDNGGVPLPFNFDYAGEAQKAYGELGAYYDRLLKESQGDMNKVLSRLVEDYDRGNRVRREDYDAAKEQARQQVQQNAQARGIYSQSLYQPGGGRGIADALLEKVTKPVEASYARANEAATIDKTRTEADTKEDQQRREFALEQERRTKAGELANQRGEQAYRKWQATSMV